MKDLYDEFFKEFDSQNNCNYERLEKDYSINLDEDEDIIIDQDEILINISEEEENEDDEY